MTPNETLLQKLADWRPRGRQTLHLSPDGAAWAVTLSADRCDELSCLLWELTLRRESLSAGDTLKAWADRVAARVTGLLETLRVLEVDLPAAQALLRSQEPAHRDDDRLYYEVVLKGTGEALVRRYRGSANGSHRREQVAFALTHEALAKLVADVTATG